MWIGRNLCGNINAFDDRFNKSIQGRTMSRSTKNPFAFLRETTRFPLSRIQRTTLWQKTADAFMVTFGMYGTRWYDLSQVLGVPKHWGIFDYLSHKFLFKLLDWILVPLARRLFSRSVTAARVIIGATFGTILLLPLIIPFGCLWLARYIVSALFTFLALPFIVLTHLATGRTLRQLFSEPSPIESDPSIKAEAEPNYFSDEIQKLMRTIRPETFLPSSSLTQIRSELDAIRCKNNTFTVPPEDKEYTYHQFFTLLINGNEIDTLKLPPPLTMDRVAQAQLHFSMPYSALGSDNTMGVVDHMFAHRRYDKHGVFIGKDPQTNIRFTDKALLSLLEAAIKLNIGHIATRFEENGTLDFVLSYLETMKEPNLIPTSVLPKEVVDNLVMEYLAPCSP
jgi:hypothetical protein